MTPSVLTKTKLFIKRNQFINPYSYSFLPSFSMLFKRPVTTPTAAATVLPTTVIIPSVESCVSSSRGTSITTTTKTAARQRHRRTTKDRSGLRYLQRKLSTTTVGVAGAVVLTLFIMMTTLMMVGRMSSSSSPFSSSVGLSTQDQDQDHQKHRRRQLLDYHSIQRRRGHRFYDYYENEHDGEFPWKTLTRSSSSSSSSISSGNNNIIMNINDVNIGIIMEDEDEKGNSNNNKDKTNYNDKSLFYTQLRQLYETSLPSSSAEKSHINNNNNNEQQRSLQAVQDLRTYPETFFQTYLAPTRPQSATDDASSSSEAEAVLYYDIYNCPEAPPVGYPKEWNLVQDVLGSWPADEMEIQHTLHQGLCVFNYTNTKEYQTALRYRDAELPFVIRGDPAVAQTVERWNTPYYLSTLMGDTKQMAEISDTGTFTYWTQGQAQHKQQPEYKEPTKVTEMSFQEWVTKANVTDESLLRTDSTHYYFQVVGCAPGVASSSSVSSSSSLSNNVVDQSCSTLAGNAVHMPYLIDELPFYTQTHASLYIKEPVEARASSSSKAINCRFGMKGVMATNHLDGERNFVTLLSGERRYILSHPQNCAAMSLFPFGHPSARHSAVDWSDPNLQLYPQFQDATANEIVLQAGESLFIPSTWFHYIASLSTNVQCNTRSGMDYRYIPDLERTCGE